MKVLLIGAGKMAMDYSSVLSNMKVDFSVVGRSISSAAAFFEKTNLQVEAGGLNTYLQKGKAHNITHAIIATGIEALADSVKSLKNSKIMNILVEKPAGLTLEEITSLDDLNTQSKIYVAYNRRFYSSVLAANKIIKEDGGISSFNFEFTEWSNDIENLDKAPGVKANWFLANSSHVVDLAFYLGGIPKDFTSYTDGELSWHKPSKFAGAGRTISNALFTYQANWEAPGRWGLEILTSKHRLYLRPMEKLSIQHINSVKIEEFLTDDYLDTSFKPGLYLQVKSFLSEIHDDSLCSLGEHISMLQVYRKMLGY